MYLSYSSLKVSGVKNCESIWDFTLQANKSSLPQFTDAGRGHRRLDRSGGGESMSDASEELQEGQVSGREGEKGTVNDEVREHSQRIKYNRLLRKREK